MRCRELVIRNGAVATVRELLEGSGLEGVLGEGLQPVDEGVRILESVLNGRTRAHGQGGHRSIKPDNIYRCSEDRVKRMNFGLARAADGINATRTGPLTGITAAL